MALVRRAALSATTDAVSALSLADKTASHRAVALTATTSGGSVAARSPDDRGSVLNSALGHHVRLDTAAA